MYKDPPSTLNWGYMVPNNGYLGPKKRVGGGSRYICIHVDVYRGCGVEVLQPYMEIACNMERSFSTT